VERSELDVLEGIEEGDWNKIQQIVMEVHNLNGWVERIDAMLTARGYRVEVNQERLLKQTDTYKLSATRPNHRAHAPTSVRNQTSVPHFPPHFSPLLTVDELQRFVQEKLPLYMVPSAFVMLEQLPLTVNGKVDNRALPAPDQSRPNMSVSFVSPRNAAEEIVADIWRQVLHREQVGVLDNFFALGGHSLLAMQIISRIGNAFQIERLPLRNLFEAPTVAGLVEVVANHWGGIEVLDEIARTWQGLEQLSAEEVDEMLSKQTT